MKTLATVVLGLITLFAAALFLFSSYCAVAGGRGLVVPGLAFALVSLAVVVGCLLCIAKMYKKEAPESVVKVDKTVTDPQTRDEGNE